MTTDTKGRYRFNVEPFTEDFQGLISWSNLGNILLRCAQMHAENNGFGFGPMSREQLSWVFSRLIIEMDRRPHTGETFEVTTWPSEIFRQFTVRLFEVRDGEGIIIGRAYSVWALIDINSRQPADLMNLPTGPFTDYLIPAPDFPITGPGRIRVKSEQPALTRTAHVSDLDINGHVNSIRSLEMVLDLFPLETYQTQQVHKVELAYAKEAFCGDTLQFFKEEVQPGVHNIEVRRGEGDVTLRAQVVFK